MLDMTFVAAVLEGIEGTLDELIGRVERSDLRGAGKSRSALELYRVGPRSAWQADRRRTLKT